MLDLDKFRDEGQSLIQDATKALGVELPADLEKKLCEAALGETGMELHRLTIAYAEEADKCRESSAWFAACLMTASAIEGILALFCTLMQSDVEQSSAYKELSKGHTYEDRIFHATFDTDQIGV